MSHKILIVDDEEGTRESLKLILSDHYEMILTDSSAQALDILDKDKSIRLVLLDIKMPQVNGLDTLKIIQEKYPAINTIMVTGYKSVEAASEASKLGACDYVVKPFKSDEILAKVKKCLE